MNTQQLPQLSIGEALKADATKSFSLTAARAVRNSGGPRLSLSSSAQLLTTRYPG